MMRTLALVIGLGAFLVAGPVQAGTDPADSCRDSKAKTAGKKASGLLKAYGKNIKKPNPVKLGQDVSKAQSKFTKGFVKAESKGGCSTTGDAATMEAKIDAFVDDAINDIDPPPCGNNFREGLEECDGTDDNACPGRCLSDCTCSCGNNTLDPNEECDGTDDAACDGLCLPNCTCPLPVCGNGVQEAGEGCEPRGVQANCAGGEICNGFCQCQTSEACDCGSATPLLYSYTTQPPQVLGGSCGSTDGAENPSLVCSGLYIGGGGGGLPVPSLVPDQGQNLFTVDFCNGTNLSLSHTTAVDTGNNRNCSAGSKCSGSGDPCSEDGDCPALETCNICYFGAPLPILDTAIAALSTCVINTISRDSLGGVDCSTGESFVDQPLNSKVHLHGTDQSPSTPGYQPCPVCVSGSCEGGPNDTLGCTPASTTYDLYDCCASGTPTMTTGGIGAPCTVNADCTNNDCVPGCTVFPTTHDCPPAPVEDIGNIPVPFALTSGTDTVNADANGSLCGWCRDVNAEASNCFEGDATPSCPASSIIDCGGGTGNTECAVVPCGSDTDCTAPYETCEQRNPGAYRDTLVTTQTETGAPGGDLRDYLPHFGVASDSFCIANSFSAAIDAQADLGGPGAVSLPGNMQLLSPSGAFVDMTTELVQ
jgi:hypothetical protein